MPAASARTLQLQRKTFSNTYLNIAQTQQDALHARPVRSATRVTSARSSRLAACTEALVRALSSVIEVWDVDRLGVGRAYTNSSMKCSTGTLESPGEVPGPGRRR